MVIYKIGKIQYKSKNYIIFDSNLTGYKIFVADIARYDEDKAFRLYLYEHKNEYSSSTFGFLDFKEKMLFEDLLSLNGVGPKTALEMLNSGWKQIATLVAQGNVDELAKFKYVGHKTARQIVFEYQDKWQKLTNNLEYTESSKVLNTNEVIETLKMLGFKRNEINSVIDKLTAKDTEAMVEEAIELLTLRPQLNATD
ncbi:Holliday junction DNA helicase [Mycoplasmopsis californica]|uniref:Holliday junction branch migration complex subunit RuvA n=1 Tax=Mycoplasmopsis equigenitalium TaxID=114883 RepID=A0ABY5J1Q8_9BACT|nr:Holliday junction branch migration protein RuvA [Mycoplasmopsis equigenitalium]UUD37183.1 Holliday junction branch migration protein RuvA [Mycoplasmopsis equigenitalium]VEU69510.1 Holliday junction DNA helicase [Mycoplasmopsis californica]